jgi:hypothetical protein
MNGFDENLAVASIDFLPPPIARLLGGPARNRSTSPAPRPPSDQSELALYVHLPRSPILVRRGRVARASRV